MRCAKGRKHLECKLTIGHRLGGGGKWVMLVVGVGGLEQPPTIVMPSLPHVPLVVNWYVGKYTVNRQLTGF